MVNYHILRLEFPRISFGSDKISLKIRIDSFMLIMCSDKFWTILIVRGTRTSDIPRQITNLKIMADVDR